MKLLQERIRREGIVRSHDVLIVSHFLNHQLDPQLFLAMAKEWQKRFKGKRIDKIMTIEASGIALAVVAGLVMEVPVVFAKKRGSVTLDEISTVPRCTLILRKNRTQSGWRRTC